MGTVEKTLNLVFAASLCALLILFSPLLLLPSVLIALWRESRPRKRYDAMRM